MRSVHSTLTRQQVHRHATDLLQTHLPLGDSKRKATAAVLWSLLLAATARISSRSDAWGRLRDVPSDEAARETLLATLPESAEPQRRLNAALAGRLPKALRRSRQRIALDLTLIPCHGQPFRGRDEVDRSQAEDGTSHLHAYATAYVVRTGQRYTVALTGVRRGEALEDVAQRLLKQAATVGIRPRLLLLDRGFYSAAVIRYLQAARYPFVMPAVCHGRSPEHRLGPSGSYLFRLWKRSGWSTYTPTGARKQAATVSICVTCRNYRGQWKRRGRQPLIYAYRGYRPRSPDAVFQVYRLRFGIEASHRQMHGGRMPTTSRRPEVRLMRGSPRCCASSGCGCITRSCPRPAGAAA